MKNGSGPNPTNPTMPIIIALPSNHVIIKCLIKL